MIFHGIRVLLAVLVALPLMAADQKLLSMLPANAEVVMGINVRAILDSGLGKEMMNSSSSRTSDLEELAAETGLDLRKDIREVVLAGFQTTPGAGAKGAAKGVALISGNFQPSRIGQAIVAKGGTKQTYAGRDLWYPEPKTSNSKDAVTFLDNSLAVAGTESEVKRFLDGVSGNASSSLRSKANSVGSRYDIWLVSMVSPAKLAGSMDAAGGAPEQAMGPLQGDMFQKIKTSQAGIKFGPQMKLGVEMEAETAEDATALFGVLQFFKSMLGSGAPKGDPAAAAQFTKMLSAVQMRTEASMVLMELEVAEADVLAMVKSAAAAAMKPAEKEEEIVVVQ